MLSSKKNMYKCLLNGTVTPSGRPTSTTTILFSLSDQSKVPVMAPRRAATNPMTWPVSSPTLRLDAALAVLEVLEEAVEAGAVAVLAAVAEAGDCVPDPDAELLSIFEVTGLNISDTYRRGSFAVPRRTPGPVGSKWIGDTKLRQPGTSARYTRKWCQSCQQRMISYCNG